MCLFKLQPVIDQRPFVPQSLFTAIRHRPLVFTMFAKASIGLAVAAAASAVSGFTLPNFAQFAVDSGLALSSLNSIAVLHALGNTAGTCNIGNIKFRQEWRTLSTAQRKNFIAAVQCLTTKPSILPAGVAPGSFSIFDDFTYVHMKATMEIHMTVSKPFRSPVFRPGN